MSALGREIRNALCEFEMVAAVAKADDCGLHGNNSLSDL
jgi:hypothetical protein